MIPSRGARGPMRSSSLPPTTRSQPLKPTSRPSLPNRPARSFHSGNENIYDHALNTIRVGGTRTMNIACDSLVRRWKQEADRSKLYNLLPGRKVDGKTIANRGEFTQFMRNIYRNFADHMSPAWQSLYFHQLEDLLFSDAFQIYEKLSDITKEYVDLEDELRGIHLELKKASETNAPLTDEQFTMYLRSVQLEAQKKSISAKINAIGSECILKASLSHTKKISQLESQPSKLKAETKKTENAAGKSTHEMKELVKLQREYLRKFEELNQIDKTLSPVEYANKEEECKLHMQALLNIVKLDPTRMGEIALKFERVRHEAGKKMDPEHFIYTEVKILNELQTQALSFLLIALLTGVAGWLVLDKLKNEFNEVENEIKTFVYKANYKQHETALDLSQFKNDFEGFDTSKYPTITAYKEDLEQKANELEKLNDKFKIAIDDYSATAKEHLSGNFVKQFYKFVSHKSYKEFLKTSNEDLNKKGLVVSELAKSISQQKSDLENGYRKMYYKLQIERCNKDVNDLSKLSLPAEKIRKINLYKKQLNKFISNDAKIISEENIQKIEVFSRNLHQWKKKQSFISRPKAN